MSEKHAMYLVKEGEGGPKLFHGDDVEAAKANGWSEPDFPKGTGAEWNHADDLEQQDAAAEVGRGRQAADAKKAKAAESAEQKADKAKK